MIKKGKRIALQVRERTCKAIFFETIGKGRKKRIKKDQKGLDKGWQSVYNIKDASFCKGRLAIEYTEKYSRGRRGAPAKGVGRVYRRESSNLSFSANKKSNPTGLLFLLAELVCLSESNRKKTQEGRRGKRYGMHIRGCRARASDCRRAAKPRS